MISDSVPRTRVVHVTDNIPGSVYVGRRNNRYQLSGSVLANPYRISARMPRRVALINYAADLTKKVIQGDPVTIDALIACRNKPLSCWCRHDGAPVTSDTQCHADFIVMQLEKFSDDALRRFVEINAELDRQEQPTPSAGDEREGAATK